MNIANIITLTHETIPLAEVFPEYTAIVIAPAVTAEFYKYSNQKVINESTWIMDQLTKTNLFSINNETVIIVQENETNSWLAAMFFQAVFRGAGNEVKLWLVNGDCRRYVDIRDFMLNGLCYWQCHQHDLQEQFVDLQKEIL